MSEGQPPVPQTVIDNLPQVPRADAAPQVADVAKTPADHAKKEGIMNKLRHLLGNESKMTGPGTGNEKPAAAAPNPNVVQGSDAHTNYSAALDRIAASVKENDAASTSAPEAPAHAGYGADAQQARRESNNDFSAEWVPTPVESKPDESVAEVAAERPEDKMALDEAMKTIQESLGTSTKTETDDRSGVVKKIGATVALGAVGAGMGAGMAGAQEAPTTTPSAQEVVVDTAAQAESPIKVDLDKQVITVAQPKVTEEITSSSKQETMEVVTPDGAVTGVAEAPIEAAEKTLMSQALEIMKSRTDLRDNLVVVKDANGAVGLYTHDGRAVTQAADGQVTVADAATKSFDGYTLAANMNWGMKQEDVIETTTYPAEGTVGEIPTATPEKYQGGMFEITTPGGTKVEACKVENTAMIAESVSFTFKDADGNALGTFGDLAEAGDDMYKAGGSIEQSLVPKAGCEKLAEQAVIAVHDQGSTKGFNENVAQPLITSGGVAELKATEDGKTAYVSRVTLPDVALAGPDGRPVCETYVQIDSIIEKALNQVGGEGGDFYQHNKRWEDVRLIKAGEGKLALVCTPAEVPPTVEGRTDTKSDYLSVPLIVIFDAPVQAPPEETPPVVTPPPPELPATGSEAADLLKFGTGLIGAGGAVGEVARRLNRGKGGGEGDSTSGSMMRPNGEAYPAAFESSKFAAGIGENDKANLEKAYFSWMRKDREGRAYAKGQIEAKLAEVTAMANNLASDDEDEMPKAA